MTEKNSTFRGAFTARSLYITTIAAVALAVACALFFVPSGNTTVQASSNDDNSYTSEFNDRGMMMRAVNFGSSARYALWAKGAVSDNGSSIINGDAGTPSGKMSIRADQVQGAIDDVSGNSKLASSRIHDVDLAFDAFSQLPCTTVDAVDLSGKTFGPGIYCLASARLAGQMTLDAQGDPTAMFLFRVLGPVAAKDGSSIELANGAASSNAFFFSETSVDIGGNAQFRAAAFSRGDINIGEGAFAGKVISTSDVVSKSATMGEGFGYIEICKQQLNGTTGLEGLYFDFFVPGAPNSGFGLGVVRVPLGACSGPIQLPVGAVNISEPGASTTPGGPRDFQRYTLVSVSSPQGGISNVNPAGRSFTAQVSLGTPTTERLINVVNRYAITGYVEICKYRQNANDTDVTGTWEFVIDLTGAFRYSTPVNQCTGPIFLVMPTTGGSLEATVNITEIARNNFINTRATTLPTDRLQAFTPATNTNGSGTGGTARVTVGEAFTPPNGPLNETVVNFFNATVPGTVKICKIAGPGIPLGTRFDFTVSGLQAPLPGTATTQTVRVAAGPWQQGGFCTFASGTFIVGSNVSVTEVLPPVDAVPNVPPGQIRVTNITSSGPIVAGPNLAARTITVRANQLNGTVVTYTNIVYRPTLLKICKVAGPGVDVGENFTFDVSSLEPQFYPPGTFPTRTVTVSAGAFNSQYGNCVFVPGWFDVVGDPPIGTFNLGQDVRISERQTNPASVVTAIVVNEFDSIIDISLANRRVDYNLIDPGVNIAVFFNSRATAALAGVSVRADMDGNGTSDFAFFNSSNAQWGSFSPFQYQPVSMSYGQPGDISVPGDYDGDRKTDTAVFRNGTWMIHTSGGADINVNWGVGTDKPVAADYDGDGRADIAVYRPSNGTWFILRSSNGGADIVQWGSSSDFTVPGDWDGDGKADIAVYRPSNGNWFILQSSGGGWYAPWGTVGDKPVAADYDGDGRMDMAIYRPSQGNWYVYRSNGTGYDVIQWGNSTDVPVPGDYNGDGRYDYAVNRNGTWLVLPSNGDPYMIQDFGTSEDTPLETMY